MPPAPTMVTTTCRASSAFSAANRGRGRTAAARRDGRLVGARSRVASLALVAAPAMPPAWPTVGAGGALERRAPRPAARSDSPARGSWRSRRPQQLAQRRDLHLQVVFLDHEARPDRVEQLVLGHELTARADQHDQQVEARAPSVAGWPSARSAVPPAAIRIGQSGRRRRAR